MQLGDVHPSACDLVTAAATELWTVSVFLQLVVDRVVAADELGAPGRLDAEGVGQLVRFAGGRVDVVDRLLPCMDAVRASLRSPATSGARSSPRFARRTSSTVAVTVPPSIAAASWCCERCATPVRRRRSAPTSSRSFG